MSIDQIEHRHDWESQRERLSAYLDDQLSDAENAELTAHLATCERCGAELAELRGTIRLLQALPQPARPRSFAIPEGARAVHVASARRTLREPPASASPRWARVAQWAGTVAASVGILLLLGTALSGALMGGNERAASMPAAAHSSTTQNNTRYGTADRSATPTVSAPASSATAYAAAGQATTAPRSADTPTPATNNQPGNTFATHASPAASPVDGRAGLEITGAALLALGALGFLFGRRARSRTR
ncbi:MAG TPA: zf-HC2 domain-containing protein [Ktedonobacterales bacterium]